MRDEKPLNFIQMCKRLRAEPDNLDDYVGFWHAGHGEPGQSLADFLGMTDSQFKAWAEGRMTVAEILND